MSDFNRIAISGKICSGKTTVAKMLASEFDYARIFFADELKTLCSDIIAYNRIAATGAGAKEKEPFVKKIWDDVERITTSDDEYSAATQQVLHIAEKYKHVITGDVYDRKTEDIRSMLQEVGTEYMRLNVNDNIWVNALEKKLKTLQGRIVVDDMRYENEYRMLRENGFVMVRLHVSKEVQLSRVRKLYGNIDESRFMHPSEIGLDHMMFDYDIDADQPVECMHDDIRTMIGVK